MAIKVLVPSGALGLGFCEKAFARGVDAAPDIIAIDGGSTDSGPYYLGTGTSKYARSRIKAEWAILMQARRKLGVPLIIGTAGTCGAGTAVEWLADITREIAAETGEFLKICKLLSDQPHNRVLAALEAGRITALPPSEALQPCDVTACSHIVALAGVEQLQRAIDTGADIIIAGRTTDTAVIAAYPIMKGCHVGAAWHGAKIGECGALATTHPSTGVILLTFDEAGFTVEPMAPEAQATPRTVSAHMLYENSDPFILYEPGGHLDVRNARYRALDARSVRVEGSAWVPSDIYTVKLEGAGPSGYQTISHVLVRDARYVAQIDTWCQRILDNFDSTSSVADPSSTTIEIRIIGRDATLGSLEQRRAAPVEVGVLVIVTAPTQQEATNIAKALNPALLHMPLEPNEPMPTFAFPFSPPETERGALYEFRMNHVMQIDDPHETFEYQMVEV